VFITILNDNATFVDYVIGKVQVCIGQTYLPVVNLKSKKGKETPTVRSGSK